MIFNVIFVTVCTQFGSVISDKSKETVDRVSLDKSINDYYKQNVQYGVYRGEKFPQKYLSVDEVQPTASDLSHYVETLARVVDYFAIAPNETDVNMAIGTYFVSAILKRALIDYGDKITNKDKSIMAAIIYKADDVLSHYIYITTMFGPRDLRFQLSRLFKHGDSLVSSIWKFNKNTISKWINSNIKVNYYIEQMDNMTLPRETYAKLVVNMEDYYSVSDSDLCLSRISSQPAPLQKDEELKQCRRDIYCEQRVFKMPTVAYAISHQYLYLFGLSLTRRCYVISEEVDKAHMEILCANMYREAVYLARRGFFYRDLFLEHIALCSMLGFEEFHRPRWFRKAASWIDEDGCMVENQNFEMNRTVIYLAKAKDSKEAKKIRNMRKMQLYEECHHHQMALIIGVLAHGIRHAAHYMDTPL